METFSALVILVASHYAVPPECRVLAVENRFPSLLTGKQAERAIAKLDRNPGYPGVRECRAAIRREWKR